MTGKTYGLTFGHSYIKDITNPQPEEIDLREIRRRLESIRRFSGNPDSLTVAQHVRLCLLIGRKMGTSASALSYLAHHDDHEAIIGDIPGPLKDLIDSRTPILREIETALDFAIWRANGGDYALPWSMKQEQGQPIFEEAHRIDKLAETVEWRFVMGQPAMPWNRPMEDWLVVEASALLAEAVNVVPG